MVVKNLERAIFRNGEEDIISTGYMDEYTWDEAYYLGYRDARHQLPVVWKHHKFSVDFDFYVQRGFIHALIEDEIKEARDAVSIDRRK